MRDDTRSVSEPLSRVTPTVWAVCRDGTSSGRGVPASCPSTGWYIVVSPPRCGSGSTTTLSTSGSLSGRSCGTSWNPITSRSGHANRPGPLRAAARVRRNNEAKRTLAREMKETRLSALGDLVSEVRCIEMIPLLSGMTFLVCLTLPLMRNRNLTKSHKIRLGFDLSSAMHPNAQGGSQWQMKFS